MMEAALADDFDAVLAEGDQHFGFYDEVEGINEVSQNGPQEIANLLPPNLTEIVRRTLSLEPSYSEGIYFWVDPRTGWQIHIYEEIDGGPGRWGDLIRTIDSLEFTEQGEGSGGGLCAEYETCSSEPTEARVAETVLRSRTEPVSPQLAVEAFLWGLSYSDRDAAVAFDVVGDPLFDQIDTREFFTDWNIVVCDFYESTCIFGRLSGDDVSSPINVYGEVRFSVTEQLNRPEIDSIDY